MNKIRIQHDTPPENGLHPMSATGSTDAHPDHVPDAAQDAIEARPAYNSRVIKAWTEYIEKQHPELSIDAILKDAGMTLFELEDPGHWFNQKQVNRFYERVYHDTRDPNVARNVGRFLPLSKTIGPLRQITLGLLNLRAVYTLMGSLSSLISRSSEVHTRLIGPNSVEIINSVRPGFTEEPYQCENRLGIYESIGKLFSDSYAQVLHPECTHRGDARCRYEITWRESLWTILRRRRNWLLLLAIPFVLAGLVLLGPTAGGILAAGFLTFAGLMSYSSEHFKAREYAETIRTQAEAARDHFKDMDLRYNNALMVKEIGQTTATLRDETQMVEAAARVMHDRSIYDRGLIMLADRNTRQLCYAAGFGYSDDIRRQLQETAFNLNKPESKGVFVKAFREKKPFLIQNIDDILDAFSERSRSLARLLLAGKSMICVPIAYEEKVLGIIAIDNSNSDRTLTQSDVSLLMGVASQLAVGIVNTRAYVRLQNSEKQYRDLVENAHSIIMRIDPSGRIVFFNKFASALFGLAQSQVEGLSVGEVLTPANAATRDWISNGAIAFEDEIPMVEETAYVLDDGREIWIAWTYRPIFSADGHLNEILCIGNDTTQLKRTREENVQLEIQLERAQKMEALGTLAGGVAHDLNNVLAGLINYPELMLMRLPSDSPLCRYVAAIQKSGERAAAIVQDLLTLARRNVVQMAVADLNAIIVEYLGSPEFERVKIHHPAAVVNARLEPGVRGIAGAPVQLSKTVMNLLTNAIEALEGRSGEVAISTENIHLDQPLDGYERIAPGDYVRLSVTDTGCGMSPEDLRRIFEPFFAR
ncbi:MAG: PAS domain S-box protein, partial [Desulfobacterales bacterium]